MCFGAQASNRIVLYFPKATKSLHAVSAGATRLFWDGRAVSLEEQALGPIESPAEMNQNLDDLVKELKDENALTGTILGTPYTMAPEILKENAYGLPCDIYR